MENEPRLSVTHLKLVPPSVVFHSPPAAAGTYHTLLSRGSMAMAAIRPEVSAGPMLRKARPLLDWLVKGTAVPDPLAAGLCPLASGNVSRRGMAERTANRAKRGSFMGDFLALS